MRTQQFWQQRHGAGFACGIRLFLGLVVVFASYKHQVARLPLVVIKGKGPSLFGRNWLEQIQLDWQETHCLFPKFTAVCVAVSPGPVSGGAGDSAGSQGEHCNRPIGHAMFLQGTVCSICFDGQGGHEAKPSCGRRYLGKC